MKLKSIIQTLIVLTVVLNIQTASVFAQNTVNATGGSQVIGNAIFEYSIGEMAVVHTAQSANITVTHGVLQPAAGTLSVEDNPLAFGLSVYPNPASDVLHLQPALSGGGTLHCIMTDMNGRTVLRQDATLQAGTEKQQMDVSAFADGTYLLHTTFTQNGKPHTKTFKIIKRNR